MSVVESYAAAFLEVAKGEGVLGQVGDELLRFSQAFESSPDLQRTLGDPSIPADRRLGVVSDLLTNAHQVTANLVSLLVGSGRSRDLYVAETAAASRQAARQAPFGHGNVVRAWR